MTKNQLQALITAILLTDQSQPDSHRTVKTMAAVAENILEECHVGSDSFDDDDLEDEDDEDDPPHDGSGNQYRP